MQKDRNPTWSNALEIHQRYTSAMAWQRREREGGRWPIHGSSLEGKLVSYSNAFRGLIPTFERSMQEGMNQASRENREFVFVDLLADTQCAREVGLGAISGVQVPIGVKIKPYAIGLFDQPKSIAVANLDKRIGLHFEEMLISLPDKFEKGLAQMLQGRKIDRAVVKGEGALQTLSPLLFGEYLNMLYKFLNPRGGTIFIEFSLAQREVLPQLVSWVSYIRTNDIPLGIAFNADNPTAVAITRYPNSPESIIPDKRKRRKGRS